MHWSDCAKWRLLRAFVVRTRVKAHLNKCSCYIWGVLMSNNVAHEILILNAKAQKSMCTCVVSPEPSLRECKHCRLRSKTRLLALLEGWPRSFKVSSWFWATCLFWTFALWYADIRQNIHLYSNTLSLKLFYQFVYVAISILPDKEI